MLTDTNLSNNLSFLSNTYLESRTITHRDGKCGIWLVFSLECVGLYLYRVLYDVVDQIARYDCKPHHWLKNQQARSHLKLAIKVR